MAKDSYTYEGGFGDDLEYKERSTPKSRSFAGKARKGLTEIGEGAYEGFFDNFSDTNRWKDAVVSELPPQHRMVVETYDKAKQTGGELYDQFVTETKPVLGEISKKLDDMVSQDSRLKALTQALKNKFYTPPPSRPSEESLLEEALSRTMTETFGGIDQLAQIREDKAERRRTIRDVADSQMNNEQHEELVSLLTPMMGSISRIEQLKLNVETKVERKKVELMFRSYMIQGRTYEHLKKSHLEMMDQVKTLVHNTGLPDYAKIERTERFGEMIRDRMMGGIQDSMFGDDGPVGRVLNKVKGDAKNAIFQFKMALQGAAMGVDSADMFVGDNATMTPLQGAGMMAGQWGGEKLREKILKPIMDKLNADPDFIKKGYDAAQFIQDPRLLVSYLRKNEKYKTFANENRLGTKVDDFLVAMNSYAGPNQKLGKFGGTGIEGLVKPGFQSERVNRAQIDVIPGYLARILQRVSMIQSGESEPMLTYDYGTNSFVSKFGMGLKVARLVKKRSTDNDYTYRANTASRDLSAKFGLKEDDQAALASVLSIIASSKTALDGGRISAFDGYARASDEEKRILEILNKKADPKQASSEMFDLRNAVNELRKAGDNMSSMFQSLIDQGHAEHLQKLGILDIDPDKPGAYETNHKAFSKIQRDGIYRSAANREALAARSAYEAVLAKLKDKPKPPEGAWSPGESGDWVSDDLTMGNAGDKPSGDYIYVDTMGRWAKSDVNAKGGVKKFDKGRALRGVRNTPVSSWMYKGKNRKRVGPMAQDVQHNFGDEVAPDGEKIDLVSMNGITMAAVQKLAEDQERLANSNQGSQFLKAIARAVGAGEPTKFADPDMTVVDYAKFSADGIAKTNYLLENGKMIVNIPGIDFSKINLGMPDIDLAKLKANGKKFADPLLRTGNEYIDTIQSLLLSAISDGFEGVKGGAKTSKKWFFDKPRDFLVDVWSRNKETIEDKGLWLYNKAVEVTGKAIDLGIETITTKIPNAIKAQINFLKNIKEGVKRMINPPRDIYVKGNGTTPVMTAQRMRAGAYQDENGKTIRGGDDLVSAVGSIRDILAGGEVVLTATQLADGVFDINGNQIRSTTSIGASLAAGGAALALRGIGKAGKWLTEGESIIDKAKKAGNYVRSGLGNMMDGITMGGFGTDARLLRLTAQIRDLLAIGKPRKLVKHVYNRDLHKYPLEGREFMALMMGEKAAEEIFGKVAESIKSGVNSDATTSATASSHEQSSAAGDFFNKMGSAFKDYDKTKSFGENFSNAWKTMGGKNPLEKGAQASNVGGALALGHNGVIGDGSSGDGSGPNLPRRGIFGRVKDAAGKLAGKLWRGKKTSNLAEDVIDTGHSGFKKRKGFRSGSKARERDNGFIDADTGSYHEAERGLAIPGAGQVVPPTRGGIFSRGKGMLDSLGRRVDGLAGGRVGKARGLAKRGMGFLGRSGLPGMALNAAKGIGGWLMGSSNNEQNIDIPQGDFTSIGPARHVGGLLENKTGKANHFDSDGDGQRDSGSTRQLVVQDENRRELKQVQNDKARESQERAAELLKNREHKEDDFMKSILGALGGLFSFFTSGIGGLLNKIGGLSGAWGLAKAGIGKAGGFIKGIAGRGAKGAGRLVGRAVAGTVARTAAVKAAMGGAATLAASTGGVVGAGAALALKAAAFAMSGPGLAIAGVALAGYGLYKGYKYLVRNNVDEFEKLRMLQYGLTEEHKDKYNKFLALEDLLKGNVSWSGGVPSINSRSFKLQDALDIFDVDSKDEEHATRFANWFEGRFKPFFLQDLMNLREINEKARYFDISTFDAKQLEALAPKLEFPSGPYNVSYSPFKDIEELPNTFSDVQKQALVVKSLKKAKKVTDIKGNNALEKTLKEIKTNKDQDQRDELKAIEAKAQGERTEAEKKKLEAEEARKKILNQSRDIASSDARAKLAMQAAREGRSFAQMYSEENERIKKGLPAATSDDGGKEPSASSSTPIQGAAPGANYTPGMRTLPLAAGPRGDATAGKAGIQLGGGISLDGMNPQVLNSLYAMADEYHKTTGKKLPITGGYRSYEKQAQLYRTMPAGRAAPPGRSLHEFGAAFDMDRGAAGELEKLGLMRKYGFTRPVGGEPWHIEPAGIQGRLDQARKDPGFISAMMEASAGRGGGGIGMDPSAPKYSRNDSYARKLFDQASSSKVNLEAKAANDEPGQNPIMATASPGSAPKATQALYKPSGPTPMPTGQVGGNAAAANSGTYAGRPTAVPTSDDGGKEPRSAGAPNRPMAGPGAEVGMGAAPKPQPKNVQEFKDAVGKYAAEAGEDPRLLQLFAGLESSMGKNQKAHMGSAQGPFQFMPDTWKEQIGKHGGKYGIAPTTTPSDLRASVILTSEYFKSNKRRVENTRGDKFDLVDAYFTHMLGAGGANTFAKLPDDAVAADALSDAARYNRNVFFDRSNRALTVGEIRQAQMQKMQRVATEYGVDFSGLISKFGNTDYSNRNTESSFSPTKPQLEKGELGNSTGTSVVANQSGPSEMDRSVKKDVQGSTSADVALRKQEEKVYNPQPQAQTARPAISANPEGVSGLREVNRGAKGDVSELVTLTRDSVIPELQAVNTSLDKLLKLYEGGATGGGANASTPTKAPEVTQRSIPRPALDRGRAYGT